MKHYWIFEPRNLIGQSRYILQGIVGNDVTVVYFDMPTCHQKWGRFFDVLVRMYFVFLMCCKHIRVLRRISRDDVILLEQSWHSLLYIDILSLFIVKNVNVYLCFLDTISLTKESLSHINQIKKRGVTVTSFDMADCEKYNLVFFSQFSRFPPKQIRLEQNTILHDFFFCGRPYDRIEMISYVHKILHKSGFKCDFFVSDVNWLGVHDYYSRLQSALCVIDFTRKDQSGLTRRPLDAMFWDKKLITDNPGVKNYDFYNENNILVLDYSKGIDAIVIKRFLKLPYVIIPLDVKRKYDVNSWYRQFT